LYTNFCQKIGHVYNSLSKWRKHASRRKIHFQPLAQLFGDTNNVFNLQQKTTKCCVFPRSCVQKHSFFADVASCEKDTNMRFFALQFSSININESTFLRKDWLWLMRTDKLMLHLGEMFKKSVGSYFSLGCTLFCFSEKEIL